MEEFYLENLQPSSEKPSICRDKDFATLNIGGRIFQLYWKDIKRYRHSRLHKIYEAPNQEEVLKQCDEYSPKQNEYYFDRHPKYFEIIWNFLRTEKIYFHTDYCIQTLTEEIEYWGYSLRYMPLCCRYEFDRNKQEIDEELLKMKAIMCQLDIADASERENKLSCCQVKLWNIMEHPHTSTLARIVSILSIGFILLSTLCLVLSSLPQYHTNHTSTAKVISNSTNNRTLFIGDSSTTPEQIFDLIEYACIAWFSLEYGLRFASVSRRLQFLVEFLNIVDVVAIFPFYVTTLLTLIHAGGVGDSLENLTRVLQVFRILRVVRVIKLARHSSGLQSLGYTLRRSYKELGLLVSFIIFGVYLFSSLVYFSEREQNTEMFPSIPGSFWWAIISMTTVGYGDVHPITPLGKMFASICCVSGVLVVALPIPIIVSNFSEFYKDKLRLEKTRKRKEEFEKNPHHLGTWVVMNSIAQNTLSFFHAFGRSSEYELAARSRQQMSEGRSGTEGAELVTAEDDLLHIFDTENWHFMDTASSLTDSVCSFDGTRANSFTDVEEI